MSHRHLNETERSLQYRALMRQARRIRLAKDERQAAVDLLQGLKLMLAYSSRWQAGQCLPLPSSSP